MCQCSLPAALTVRLATMKASGVHWFVTIHDVVPSLHIKSTVRITVTDNLNCVIWVILIHDINTPHKLIVVINTGRNWKWFDKFTLLKQLLDSSCIAASISGTFSLCNHMWFGAVDIVHCRQHRNWCIIHPQNCQNPPITSSHANFHPSDKVIVQLLFAS